MNLGSRTRAAIGRVALSILMAGSAPFPAASAEGGPAGAIRGKVTDRDGGAPLPRVRVAVLELPLGAFSDDGGNFLIEHVPPGSYTLSLSREGYEKGLLTGIAVSSGRLTETRAELAQQVVDLDEMVVSGTEINDSKESGALEIRAASTSVQDAISSELMSRAGASDVAGALKHVVGTTVTEGKYAVVRGLSDRYTGTTLNGVRVPSADPRRRAVQMDLFPTGTIESVTVTKTFTPDLQGDFTGGGIDMKTHTIPAERTLSVSATSEYNTQATGNGSFLTYDKGGVNPMARMDPDRALPSQAEEPLPQFPRLPGQTEQAAAYDSLVRSFQPVIGTSTSAPASNESFNLLGGDRISVGASTLGLMGGLTQTHKYDFYGEGLNNTAVVSDPQQGIAVRTRRVDSQGTEESLFGVLGSAVLQINPSHTVSFQVLRNRSSEDSARLQVDRQAYPLLEQNQALHYTQRDVRSTQLHGTHILGAAGENAAGSGPLLEWNLAHNSTLQDEPDVRFFRNVFDEETLSGSMNFPGGSTDPQNTRRIFRNIEEQNNQGGADVTIPIVARAEGAGRIKTGLRVDRSDRDYQQDSFFYTFPRQFSSQTLPYAGFQATAPDQLWTDIFLEPDRIGLTDDKPPQIQSQLLWAIRPAGDDVDYAGKQAIDAAYVMGDVPVLLHLRVIGGLRWETTDLSIVPVNDTFGKVSRIEITETGDRVVNPNVPQEEGRADIDDRSLLPSIGFIYEVQPGQNVRLSWSRTLARPTFRELAPVATEEFIFGDEFMGNPDLTLSKITNFDLRWEMFPRSGDVLSASVFHKKIQDPIEVISFAAGGRSFLQPVNFESGSVQGIELEARASVGLWIPQLHGLSAGMNLTLIHSSVDVPEDEQESLASFGLEQETRRLQGQPAYLLNVDLMYENERTGWVAGLFYNRVGETLVSGAARGADDANPNVFQEPFGTLDLKVTKKFLNNITASFIARNLLQPSARTVYRKPDGEEVVKSERETAAVLGASLGWSW